MAKNPSPFDQACKAVGSQAELARVLGRHKATVSRWRREGVPIKDCPAVQRATGVRCEELRPDFDWDALREVAQ